MHDFLFGTLGRGKSVGWTVAAMLFWPIMVVWRPVDWRPVLFHVAVGLGMIGSAYLLGVGFILIAVAWLLFILWHFGFPVLYWGLTDDDRGNAASWSWAWEQTERKSDPIQPMRRGASRNERLTPMGFRGERQARNRLVRSSIPKGPSGEKQPKKKPQKKPVEHERPIRARRLN